MASVGQCLAGTQLLRLDKKQQFWEQAKWAKGSDSKKRKAVLNGAFLWYYSLRSGLARCKNPGKATMVADLLDAAKAGSGWSDCDNLNETFAHAAPLNRYMSNNTARYSGGLPSVPQSGIGGINDCPKGAVQFLHALEASLKKRAKIWARSRVGLFRHIPKLAKKGKVKPKDADWKKVADYLTRMNEAAVVYEALRGTPIGRASGWISKASTFHAGITEAIKCYHRGRSYRQAMAVGSFVAALQMIPILGQIYGTYFSFLPAIERYGRAIRVNRELQMTRATGTNWYSGNPGYRANQREREARRRRKR